MKRFLIGATLGLSTIFALESCNKEQDVSFNMVHEGSIEIPGSTVENVFFEERSTLFESSLDTNLTLNKTNRELITSVYPKSVSISSTSGFSYLSEVQVFLGNADGDTVAISKLDTLTEEQQYLTSVELPLISDEQDLMSFAKEDLLYYTVRLKTNSFTPNERTFTVSSTMGVDATRE